VDKLKAISGDYRGSSNNADIAKLGAQIAREFSDGAKEDAEAHRPLLAIPFTAPAGDAAAEKLVDSTFAMVYGMAAASHRGLVGLTKEALPCGDLATSLERGRANRSAYILCGSIDTQGPSQTLTVKIAEVADGSLVWSKSYPAQGLDPAKIAAEVASHVPSLDDD
jgi:TolB-like protein